MIRHACLVLFLFLGLSTIAAADDGRRDDRARRRTPVVEVFESARDAVVNISSSEIITQRTYRGFDRLFEDFFDMPARPRTRQYTRTSIGSGFVIHPDGYILTNAHVVRGTTERKAIFADGNEYDADLIAIDVERDVAVLKIVADRALPKLPLGRSDDLMIGETVIAIGNSLGYQHTVTSGVISATHRSLQISSDLTLQHLVQTDASINPGNSGGPLLNVLGELIGMNTAIRGDAQNIGFAIPVDQIRDVLPDLIDVERRQRIVSGLTISQFDEPRVLAVAPDSPATRAGIRPDDLLVAVENRPVNEGIDFDIALIGRQPGETLALELRRGDRLVHAAIELDARPAPDGLHLARERLGLEVHPLPDDLARRLRMRRAHGLLVIGVQPDGPADELGIEPNDILLALGRHYVTTVDDLGQLLEVVESGQVIEVGILRMDGRWGKVKLSGALRVP